MNLVESILNYLSNKKEGKEVAAPEGVCPNCWGEQEYDQKIRTLAEDKQISVNNKTAHHAFIQDFVITHLDGIKLKKTATHYECPSCKLMKPLH